MTRALFLAAGLLALAAPAAAQSGCGQPSPGQYRLEQRTTADLNRAQDDPGVADDEAWSSRPLADARRPRPGYGDYADRAPPPAGGDYDRDRAAYERELRDSRRARADYRRRADDYRADLARWRERVDACNAGVRGACAGYEERYGSYAGGRYAPPAPSYDDRRYAPPRADWGDRHDDRARDVDADWRDEENDATPFRD